MQWKLPKGKPYIDGPFRRGRRSTSPRDNASVTRRYPPELTEDPQTDWVLWELSLTLAEIARDVQTRPELQSPSQEEAQCDRR